MNETEIITKKWLNDHGASRCNIEWFEEYEKNGGILTIREILEVLLDDEIENYRDRLVMRAEQKLFKLLLNEYTGELKRYYLDGKLKRLETYKNGRWYGLHITYYRTGTLASLYKYTNDLEDGMCYTWYRNGQISAEKSYINGKLIKWTTWDENGRITKNGER